MKTLLLAATALLGFSVPYAANATLISSATSTTAGLSTGCNVNDGGSGSITASCSGGGFSTVWTEPSYQQGTTHGGKQRAVPDVAYNAAILHGVDGHDHLRLQLLDSTEIELDDIVCDSPFAQALREIVLKDKSRIGV